MSASYGTPITPHQQHYPTLSSLDVDSFLATPNQAQVQQSMHQAPSDYDGLVHPPHYARASWETQAASQLYPNTHPPYLVEPITSFNGAEEGGERREFWSNGHHRSRADRGKASAAAVGENAQHGWDSHAVQAGYLDGSSDVVGGGGKGASSSAACSGSRLSALEDAVHSVFYREWNDRRLSCDMEGQELAAQIAEMKIVHPGMEHKFGLLASHRVDRLKRKDIKYRQTYHTWATTYRNKLNQLRATAKYRSLLMSQEQKQYLLENFRDTKSSHAGALADPTAEEQEIAFSRVVWDDFAERALTPALQSGKQLSLQLIADASIPYSYGKLSWQNTTKYLRKYLENVEGFDVDQMDQLSAMQRAKLPGFRRRGRRTDYEMGL